MGWSLWGGRGGGSPGGTAALVSQWGRTGSPLQHRGKGQGSLAAQGPRGRPLQCGALPPGLEPEVQKLIAKHKQEVKKLKCLHEAELLQADTRAAQRFGRQLEQLREHLEREKEALGQQERERAQQRCVSPAEARAELGCARTPREGTADAAGTEAGARAGNPGAGTRS